MLTDSQITRLLDIANAGCHKGLVLQARAIYDGVLAVRPGHVPALIGQALSHIVIGEYDEAEKLLCDGILSEHPDDADAKKAHYARVQEFAARFKAEHETIICRELLKNIALKKESTSEPEARTEDYYRTRPCVRFVETAATILAQMLAE